jgi:hypothetical protein
LDGLADWRRPEGDRMTSLCDGDVVLSSVLAEEQPLFTIEQACQVKAAYRYVYLEFHSLCPPLFFVFLVGLNGNLVQRLRIAR